MSLLAQEPEVAIAKLGELLGIAVAMEQEAVDLYVTLEAAMIRQGNEAVASVFSQMVQMEQRHVGDIAQFGRNVLGHPVPRFPAGAASVHRRVIAPTADEAASVALTPYRALSIAVRFEERAFAFYTYLAAEAPNPELCRHAEGLATEELQHASQLRRERRSAYHHQPKHRPRAIPESASALAVLARALQEGAATVIGQGQQPNCDSKSLWDMVRTLEGHYEIYSTIAERAIDEEVMAEALVLAESVLADLALARQRLIANNTSPSCVCR